MLHKYMLNEKKKSRKKRPGTISRHIFIEGVDQEETEKEQLGR